MLALYNDVTSLCARIEERWLRYNYASEDFHKVVWEETESFDLTPLGDVVNQLRLLEYPSVRATQIKSTFSDLYMQIFHNGRFLIEILNWSGSHVNVHDHDFSGVQFQLKGDALNVLYDFTPDSRHDGALRLGKLGVREALLWKEGGRSIVRSGTVDPHGVFHLGKPTTSLLIRTVPTPRLGVQSNYFPTLAAHYTVQNDIQRKKLTGLSLLLKQDTNGFRDCLQRFLDTQSLAENFFMMLKLGARLFQGPSAEVIQAYAGRGEKEAKIVASVAYNNGIDFFKNLTHQLDSQDERLAVFAVSAAANAENLQKITRDLARQNLPLNLKSHFASVSERLTPSERDLSSRYLKLFGVQGAAHA